MTSATIHGLPELQHALEEGWTLPAAWYSDPDVLAQERLRIFASAWQYAGPSAQVAEPASFFASVAGHVPVAIVRGRDGELRGFVNVCRHRGHIVVEGAGCRETLQCPYHAWTYGLDGALRKAPRIGARAGFDPACVLPPARLGGDVGPLRVRQPRPRRRPAGRRSRRPARPRRARAASTSSASASTRITSGSRR